MNKPNTSADNEIIAPSLSFEGSSMQNNTQSKYIREDVRQVTFSDKANSDGAFLFFLPAYKLDRHNQGVWFHKFSIRSDFGDRFKERYYVRSKDQDPAFYFERNYKLLFPEDAKPSEIKDGNITRRKYPNYGRYANRAVFNVAYAQSIDKGVHVLDLPIWNGADKLEKHHTTPSFDGTAVTMVNDPNQATPVFVKLNKNSPNPWEINLLTDKKVKLPLALAARKNLYDLENIYIERDPREIVEMLREMYDASVFERCMEGHPLVAKLRSTSFGGTAPVETPKAQVAPAQQGKSASSVPDFAFPADVELEVLQPDEDDVAVSTSTTEIDSLETTPPARNPSAGKTVSSEDVRRMMGARGK